MTVHDSQNRGLTMSVQSMTESVLEEIKRKRTKICITCNHFRYSTTETFATILTCPKYEKRIPQGDHLLKGCEYWQKNRTIFSPEAS